jgi:hypothetical protein
MVVIGLVTLHVFYFSNYFVEKQNEEMQKAKTLLGERLTIHCWQSMDHIS